MIIAPPKTQNIMKREKSFYKWKLLNAIAIDAKISNFLVSVFSIIKLMKIKPTTPAKFSIIRWKTLTFLSDKEINNSEKGKYSCSYISLHQRAHIAIMFYPFHIFSEN